MENSRQSTLCLANQQITMAEIFSKLESVICHYKDGVMVAITHSNGQHKLMPVNEEMSRKQLEEFYEVDLGIKQ